MRRSIAGLLAGVMCVALAFGANAAPGSQNDEQEGWYGPGAMMGPGMMGGYGGYGMAPQGICGGFGADMMQGYGPGMMGGYHGYGMDWQGRGGYGMSGGGWMFHQGMMGYRMLHALNLTDEQVEKIRHIMDAQRKEMWAQMGNMMDARERLYDLYTMDQPDPGKVGDAYADVSRIRQKMIEARVRSRNEIWNLLTKEQREQLQEWRRGDWGYGPHRKGRRTMRRQ